MSIQLSILDLNHLFYSCLLTVRHGNLLLTMIQRLSDRSFRIDSATVLIHVSSPYVIVSQSIATHAIAAASATGST
ncbi:Molecular chaperone, DnaJ family protein [Giardia duodenalis]|uniref:Molecular chaperone, DnaJ family protein n=1 Tax=Giardia intestinalis TaxID=5741 RepID=V6TE27_GIAIN|nr:Molecular chaperone, DnaJ family protein [Giardia intestinalis]